MVVKLSVRFGSETKNAPCLFTYAATVLSPQLSSQPQNYRIDPKQKSPVSTPRVPLLSENVLHAK